MYILEPNDVVMLFFSVWCVYHMCHAVGLAVLAGTGTTVLADKGIVPGAETGTVLKAGTGTVPGAGTGTTPGARIGGECHQSSLSAFY